MSYKVELKPSGRGFAVADEETILHAAIDQNIGLPYGCRNGLCGSCVSKLVSGEVDYPGGRPERLDQEAEDACLTCKAVPRSDLTLEVRVTEQAEEIKPKLMPCRVAKVDQLAHDVIRLNLKLPDQQRLQFLAGQYLDFVLADGSRRA
ncbi:MAG: 2Fe-2S iron-sulfur cluster-binding protein, partial [bacterium]